MIYFFHQEFVSLFFFFIIGYCNENIFSKLTTNESVLEFYQQRPDSRFEIRAQEEILIFIDWVTTTDENLSLIGTSLNQIIGVTHDELFRGVCIYKGSL